MILQDAATALRANSALVALVADRIDYIIAPQSSTYPRIVLTLTAVENQTTINNDTQMRRNEIQVDAWGRTYTDADAVAEAARVALEPAGYVYLSRNTDEFTVEPGNDPGVFKVGLIFSIWIDP